MAQLKGGSTVSGYTIFHLGNFKQMVSMTSDVIDFKEVPTVSGTEVAKKATVSTVAPAGGVDGDVWYVIT